MRNLLTIIFAITSFIAFSQDKSLTGIWELKKTKNQNGELIELPIMFYKIFTVDGQFSNVRLTNNGAIISHYGKFKTTSSEDYSEVVTHSIMGTDPEKEILFKYKLSEDKKNLILEGDIPIHGQESTFNLYEVWKKVEMPTP